MDSLVWWHFSLWIFTQSQGVFLTWTVLKMWWVHMFYCYVNHYQKQGLRLRPAIMSSILNFKRILNRLKEWWDTVESNTRRTAGYTYEIQWCICTSYCRSNRDTHTHVLSMNLTKHLPQCCHISKGIIWAKQTRGLFTNQQILSFGLRDLLHFVLFLSDAPGFCTAEGHSLIRP